MSAERSPCWGWAECVLSIFTASTGLSSPRVPPLNGFVAGGVGDGEVAVVPPGAAGGGEAVCAPPEQATSAPQARTPPVTTSRRVWNRTIDPFRDDISPEANQPWPAYEAQMTKPTRLITDRRPPAGRSGRRFRRTVVYLEELRQCGVPGQRQQPGEQLAARAPIGRRGVVVKAPREGDLLRRRFQLVEQGDAVLAHGDVVSEVRLFDDRAQRPGQVALGELPAVRVGRPGLVRGGREQQAGGGIEQARGGQLEGDGGAPDERGVERRARGVHPRVEPIQPGGPPRDVQADDEQDARHQEDVEEPIRHHSGHSTGTLDTPGITGVPRRAAGTRRLRRPGRRRPSRTPG